ncbi:MAG: Transcriptional regulator, TetR family protein, partial [bacterium]|nr:Transcriptional regulator, TetR family protein [bacterium]
MARPTTISDESILEAARAVFLEHGLAATTAEVAKRAGVAEGSIFKRFATKAELFKAAMKVDFEDPDFLRTLVAARDEDDPRETLFLVGM